MIPKGKNITCNEGDYIRAGEALMDGAENPHDILKIQGEVALATYLLDEMEVYRLQGDEINDKHIEVIVRQMLRRVKIKQVEDTPFLVDGTSRSGSSTRRTVRRPTVDVQPQRSCCSVSPRPASLRIPSCRQRPSRRP